VPAVLAASVVVVAASISNRSAAIVVGVWVVLFWRLFVTS
jgi:hypothetical protein